MVTAPATLITIPLSHYCEKARWGLDRVAMPYGEDAHIPLLHRISTLRNGGGTVPLLVHGSRRLLESAAILAYADSLSGKHILYPSNVTDRNEVKALENKFDRELGPQTRRWAYAHLLDDKALLRHVWSLKVPRGEARLVPFILPIARRLVRKAYRVSTESGRKSLDRVHQLFEDVGARLSGNRRYLIGDRLTAADITFASLAAPVLFPAECRAALPVFETLPESMQQEIKTLRTTAAGQFALRLYATERSKPTKA